ncbi:MAG: permease of the major facilitator superfamily [Caulobacter sp.]|nr:permease of the major facilitator superfamily [Caulobacter sp.]
MSTADGEPRAVPLGDTEAREEAIEDDLERGLDPALDPGLDPEAEYQKFVWANLPRNYIANYLHGMLGMTGFRLINAPTFIPVYLGLVTGSPLLVGVGLGLQQLGGVISPMVGANFIEHRKRVMPTAMWLGAGMRVPVLLMALAGWFMATGHLLAVTMLVLLFLFGLFGGAQRVVFQLLMAKVIPIQRRGRLQGWRNLTGGAIAAVLGFFAGSYLVKGNVFGNGYATTFLLAFVLTSLGITALRLLLIEPEPPTQRAATSLWQRLKDVPALIQADPNFRNFLVAQLLTMAARVAAPIYASFALMTGHLPASDIGWLTLAYLGADTVSNLAWGYMGDKTGFRLTYVASLTLWIAATVLLVMSHDLVLLLVAFAGLGAGNAGYQMSTTTMVLEFGHRDDVAMRLAISSTAEGIMSSIAPMFGGWLATVAGSPPVFWLSVVVQLAALALLVATVREPKRGARTLA